MIRGLQVNLLVHNMLEEIEDRIRPENEFGCTLQKSHGLIPGDGPGVRRVLEAGILIIYGDRQYWRRRNNGQISQFHLPQNSFPFLKANSGSQCSHTQSLLAPLSPARSSLDLIATIMAEPNSYSGWAKSRNSDVTYRDKVGILEVAETLVGEIPAVGVGERWSSGDGVLASSTLNLFSPFSPIMGLCLSTNGIPSSSTPTSLLLLESATSDEIDST